MKLSILLAAASLAVAGAALAQPGVKSSDAMTICLNGAGHKVSANCVTRNASRLDTREDVCSCPGASREVKAPVCAYGQNPPGESAAYEQARLKSIVNGRVEGTWQGQPMCVAPLSR
ncbi:hypothetical protein [Phenylobacterium sp.]|uniref:hypothetical protein n=1 Tax=Phenylobacterium sp. TaxID=1871053 RepID=UPI00122BC698|nr:hypothetical protein [Phenylobacterium sp.]THD61236.1 MAG: hypothetical protein E8A49_09510 [Phenylobacterium sp.]